MVGAMNDYAMVLGTNAMVEFGMQTVYTDGSVIKP